MKDVRYIRKEKGVSPVIATILMVAITVVLAATVYIMVSGLGGTSAKNVIGNLTYRSDMSSIGGDETTDYVTFEITLSQPSKAPKEDVTITVLYPNGTVITNNPNKVWIDVTSDITNVNSGDLLKITGIDFDSGYQVIISIKGYDGTITGKVP